MQWSNSVSYLPWQEPWVKEEEARDDERLRTPNCLTVLHPTEVSETIATKLY